MVKILKAILILLLLKMPLFSGCPNIGPELWVMITDTHEKSWTIAASVKENTIVYKYDKQKKFYVVTHEYDDASYTFNVKAGEQTECEGIDWIADTNVGESINPDLGYGVYNVQVVRGSDQFVLNFTLDWRWARETYKAEGIGSPDIWLYISREANGSFIIEKQQADNRLLRDPFQSGTILKVWEHFGKVKDFSYFTKNIEMTNDFNGIVNTQINTTLNKAPYGFPEEPYTIGHQFSPGDFAHYWLGVTYGFEVTQNIIDGTSKIRHWNTSGNLGYTKDIEIENSGTFTQIKPFFKPVLPLTVTNNLEGGSGGTWQVKWDKMNDYEPPISSGVSFYAFDNSQTQDLYTIEIEQSPSNLLGTNWQFLEWQDDLAKNRIRTEAIINSNSEFTANYKGHFRSNSANAFSSNSQRKLVRTDDGIYYMVYESYGQIWETASSTTNFNNNWVFEDIPFDNFKSVNPSLDYFSNNKALVYERINTDNGAYEIVLYLYDVWSSDVSCCRYH